MDGVSDEEQDILLPAITTHPSTGLQVIRPQHRHHSIHSDSSSEVQGITRGIDSSNNGGPATPLFRRFVYSRYGFIGYTLVISITVMAVTLTLAQWDGSSDNGPSSGISPACNTTSSTTGDSTSAPPHCVFSTSGDNTLSPACLLPSGEVKDHIRPLHAEDVYWHENTLWFPRRSISNNEMVTLNQEFNRMGVSFRAQWYSSKTVPSIEKQCQSVVDNGAMAVTVPSSYYSNIFHFSHDVMFNIFQAFLSCQDCTSRGMVLSNTTYLHHAASATSLPPYQAGLLELLSDSPPLFLDKTTCVRIKRLTLATRTFLSLYKGVETKLHNTVAQRYTSYLRARLQVVHPDTDIPPPYNASASTQDPAKDALKVLVLQRQPSGVARSFWNGLSVALDRIGEDPVFEGTPLTTEIVDMARLSFVEQVAAFARADIVVGVHGAGLTSSWFLRPNTLLIQVMPEALCPWLGSNEYMGLAHAAGAMYSEYCIKHGRSKFTDNGIGISEQALSQSWIDYTEQFQIQTQTKYVSSYTDLRITTKEWAHILYQGRLQVLRARWNPSVAAVDKEGD